MDNRGSSGDWLQRAKRKIVRSPLELARTLQRLTGARPLVCVKGVYDMLHTGHVMSMMAARGFGSTLIAGVNTDDAVRKRKGPSRPVIPEEDRLLMVASLECVDWVTTYGEESPFLFLKALKPEIFVASHFSFFTDAERAEVAQNTRLRTVAKVGRFSTTEIIRRASARCGEKGSIPQ